MSTSRITCAACLMTMTFSSWRLTATSWITLTPWLERAGFSEDELTRFKPFGQGL